MRRRAVAHCKEVDILAEKLSKQKEVQLQKDSNDKADNMMNAPVAKGLCLNCDNTGICKLAPFGTEVVFCEEHSSNFDNPRQDRISRKIFADVPDLGVKNLIPGWDA